MFAFCDVHFHSDLVVRGVLLHHEFNEGIHLFTRNPDNFNDLKVDGYVAYVPLDSVRNIEYFSYVNLYERLSAVSMLKENQKQLFRIELNRHLLHKGLVGIEELLDRMTIEESMVLLTEVEAGKYEFDNGVVKKHLSEGDVYEIDFHSNKTLTWLLASYMDITQDMKGKLASGEVDLTGYRETFYLKSIEDIAGNLEG